MNAKKLRETGEKLLNKDKNDELIKDLEEDINHYCGDYGTLEHQVEYTFYKILLILKELNVCDIDEKEHNNEFKIWKDERHQLLDYKSRCEKAIEYINERKNLNWYADGVFVEELLNILNGGNEE